MTDAAYTYYQTERERKASRTGAFHKKNGSRSKKCTLPSDKLTARQRKELNGKVETYNLGKPMNWVTFLQMPDYLQDTYLKTLIEQYGARQKDACEMFGIAKGTLWRYLKSKFPDKPFWDGKRGMGTPSEKWLEWLGNWNPATQERSELVKTPDVDLPSEDAISSPEPSDAVKQPEETKVIEEKKEVSLEVLSGTLKYVGDPYAAFTKALLAFDTSKDYDIYISFRQVGKGE